ncbi:unnamed protein product [Somion occarium]|uniref:Uncharacterized protein n=1 Tax=Somion occarium TaxID=3059160 RepID=A0ABP1DEL3_9APHY
MTYDADLSLPFYELLLLSTPGPCDAFLLPRHTSHGFDGLHSPDTALNLGELLFTDVTFASFSSSASALSLKVSTLDLIFENTGKIM